LIASSMENWPKIPLSWPKIDLKYDISWPKNNTKKLLVKLKIDSAIVTWLTWSPFFWPLGSTYTLYHINFCLSNHYDLNSILIHKSKAKTSIYNRYSDSAGWTVG